MTFLPIVERELRVVSRRPSTYWSRCSTLFSAIVASCFIYSSMSWGGPQSMMGRQLFCGVSGLAFFFCLMTGVRNTADCISSEKREGTLGLLFLTDLKGYDVVFGKLVATSMRSFFDLLAVVPVLAIPFLMGGITNSDMIRATTVLCNTFFFSLSAGMFMSTISVQSRKAMSATFLIVGVLPIGALIARNTIDFVERSFVLKWILDECNPINCMLSTFIPNSSRAGLPFQNEFWLSVLIIHSAAWVFLILSCVLLPRVWQDKPGTVASHKRRKLMDFLTLGGTVGRNRFRRRLLDTNAFYWLASRERFRPASIWLSLSFLLGLWIWGYVENGHFWFESGIYFTTLVCLNSLLKLAVCSQTGRRLGEDRKIGALELILSTPLTVKDIIRGQLLSLRRIFLWPIVTVLCIEGIYLMVCLQEGGNSPDDIKWIIIFSITMMVMLVADCVALAFTSMWTSVTANNPAHVTGMAYRKVVVFPSAFIVMLFYAIGLESGFSSNRFNAWLTFWLLYTLIGLTTSSLNAFMAWGRLNARLREVATQRFTPKISFLGRIFGKSSGIAGDSTTE